MLCRRYLRSVAEGNWFAAILAAQGPISEQTRLPRGDLGVLKPFRHLAASSKAHLVGSLAVKRGMRKMRVMLLDVERDELSHGRNAVERVEVQPLALEHSPPRLDKGAPVGRSRDGYKRFA